MKLFNFTKDDFTLNKLSLALLIILVAGGTFFFPFFMGTHRTFGAITHNLGNGSTLTVDGSKRSIISRADYTCAEPAPDAMSTIATKLAASLGAGPGPEQIKVATDAVSDPKTQQLFRRTQGIQAIRDGMFRLCEARMNTAVEPEFYEEQMTDLLSTLNFIVPLELCINASTKMGELFRQFENEPSAPQGPSSAALITNYISLCLDISKEYGLVLAKNAAERRNTRREHTYSIEMMKAQTDQALAIEKVRTAAFIQETKKDQSEPAQKE